MPPPVANTAKQSAQVKGDVLRALNLVTLIGWILLLITTPASSASFNCEKAGKAIEKFICSDSSLSAFDDELGRLYRELRKSLDQTDSANLRTEQRMWLKQRNKCGDASCLQKAYFTRIKELELALSRGSESNQSANIISASSKATSGKHSLDLACLESGGDKVVDFFVPRIPLPKEMSVAEFLAGRHVLSSINEKNHKDENVQVYRFQSFRKIKYGFVDAVAFASTMYNLERENGLSIEVALEIADADSPGTVQLITFGTWISKDDWGRLNHSVITEFHVERSRYADTKIYCWVGPNLGKDGSPDYMAKNVRDELFESRDFYIKEEQKKAEATRVASLAEEVTKQLVEKYVFFLAVQDCYELRESYLQQYVDARTFRRVKEVMKTIEADAKRQTPTIDVAKVWRRATDQYSSSMGGTLMSLAKLNPAAYNSETQEMCSLMVYDLTQSVPNIRKPKPF